MIPCDLVAGCDAGASYPAYGCFPARSDKAFTPHPTAIAGCDAGASYPAYGCSPAELDKAFTPHPARSPFRRHIRRPLQTGAIFLHLPQWLRFM
ncbi:TPA: hypothetical protein JS183_001254 [Escherichia coli]|nr:hypothetical protein [Escherichia coli]